MNLVNIAIVNGASVVDACILALDSELGITADILDLDADGERYQIQARIDGDELTMAMGLCMGVVWSARQAADQDA